MLNKSVLCALWLACLPLACQSRGRQSVQLEAIGAEVLLADGTGFSVPNAYHQVPGRDGRVFRMRGGAKTSYDTIVVQRREEGGMALLDEALETVLASLEALDNFDLLDVQLRHVGPHLALSYAADFDHLEVPRRQWGILIGTPAGIVAVLMTSPKDTFHEASDDYMSVLASLHTSSAPSLGRTPDP